MGRMRGVLLAAGTTVAVCAAAAPAVAAEAPQWQHCAKTVQKDTGNYSDKTCSVASTPGQGKYEILPGGGRKPLKGKATGPITGLVVVRPGHLTVRLECENASITGHPVAPGGLADARIGMSRCHWQIGKCDSFETEPLSGRLGWLDASTGSAGLALTSEKSPGTGVIANVDCEEGVKFRVTGSFIAGIAPSGGLTTSHTVNLEVGNYLGEPSPGDKPITNQPEWEEGFVGTLQTEYSSYDTEFEFTPEGGLPSGLEGTFALGKEALGIS